MNNVEIVLANMDNMEVDILPIYPNVIYADMIYENHDLSWIIHYWDMLAENGVFIVQTDYHTSAEVCIALKDMPDSVFIAEVIYKQEWGGVPKKGFPMKHDNIWIFSNGTDWKWHGDRIQIPKQMVNAKFNPSGRTTKTPCSVFDDLGNFSTTSAERIKGNDNRNIRWQKPMKLMDRLLLPFTDVGDWVLDPFMGSGTTGVWCRDNGRNFFGVEYDSEIFKIARDRIESNKP